MRVERATTGLILLYKYDCNMSKKLHQDSNFRCLFNVCCIVIISFYIYGVNPNNLQLCVVNPNRMSGHCYGIVEVGN